MAAADTARLIASLELKDQFTPGINKALGGVDKLETRLSRIGGIAARGASKAAANIAKIGVVAGGLLAKSVQEASDLNEQINKSNVVFGQAAASVLAFSKTTAGALGLSQAEALEAAGSFGNMFNTVGLATDVSADFSKRLVTLAADMASFNNEDPTEMLLRLRSGLSGEAEPLRRFGVLLSEARVKEEAYATGIAKSGDALTEAQKVQARYALILKDSAVQQGDFARTSDSLANQQRILSANLKNAGATIGTAVLPQVTKLAIKLNDLIVKNQPAIEAFAAQLPAAFDKGLAFAERIPWAQIGSGLKTAAEWAGKLIEVFTSLPPEVQTTIIALAGLNKLSGGAVSGIVSELGKGLIKGVLNTNAAVMNVRAGVVNGVGGGVGGAAAAGGASLGSKLVSAASKVFIIGMAAGLIAELAGIRGEQEQANVAAGADVVKQGEAFAKAASTDDIAKSLAGIEKYQQELITGLSPESWAYAFNIDGVRDRLEDVKDQLKAQLAQRAREEHRAGERGDGGATPVSFAGLEQTLTKGFQDFRAGEREAGTDIAQGLYGIEKAIAQFGYTPSEWEAIYAKAAEAGGTSQINTLARIHDAASAIAIADAETSKFLSGTAGPFFRDGKNQTRLLASLEAAQQYFNTHGDTATAARLSADIAALKAKIGEQKPPIVNVNATFSAAISLRDQQLHSRTQSTLGFNIGGV